MAAGEHRRFNRQFTAGVAVAVLLAGISYYTLVERAVANGPKRSQSGDACPLRSRTRNSDTALEGVVAFDRTAGKVVWTNVAPPGSQFARRGTEFLIVRPDDRTERVVNPRTGAVTSCGEQTDDVVVSDTGAASMESHVGATFELGSLTIEAAGDGADVRAVAPDGSELWATDAGNPAVGGRATVEYPIHAAALTPDGRSVVVLTGTALEEPD
jgi:hypothetical protein